MADIERLPSRVDSGLARSLGVPDDLEIHPRTEGTLPYVRCRLARPITTRVVVTVRVHTRAGIPLAWASAEVNPGDRVFEAPMALLAMEGYSRLGRRARQDVEYRVWSRRAFATVSAA